MRLLTFTFNARLFVLLMVTFVLFTVIGTLSHEWGHWIVARGQGRQATINYMSMRISPSDQDPREKTLEIIYEKYGKEIKAGLPYPEKKAFESRVSQLHEERMLVSAGGPLQTIITGTLGFILILFLKDQFLRASQLNLWQWLLVFVSLFWLRQLCNFVVFLTDWALRGGPSLTGDELLLEAGLRLPPFSIIGSTALIALLVALIVIFRFIPLRQRFTFIMAGLTGGSLGYYLWLYAVGPLVLP